MASLSGDLATVGDSGFPASFLYSLGGAKALSAGYAWTVMGDDATSAFFNPATLLKLGGSAMSLSYSALGQDRTQVAASFALYDGASDTYESFLRTPKVFAFSMAYQTVGSVPGFDTAGLPAGTLDNYSMMAQFTYASALSRDARVGGYGIGLRAIMEDYDGSSNFGLALSTGLEVSIVNIIRLGASFNNLGFLQTDTEGLLWLNPLFSAAAKFNLPMIPVGFVVQGDKVLGDGRKLSEFVMRTAVDFTIFSVKPDPGRLAIEAGMAGGLPSSKNEEILELVARIGLVEANDLYGGLSLRWNSIELSYGMGQDSLGYFRHSLSFDIYF
jgi:hypothetical protein